MGGQFSYVRYSQAWGDMQTMISAGQRFNQLGSLARVFLSGQWSVNCSITLLLYIFVF